MNNFSHEKISGIILCGGQSKRMKRSKARLPFGNEMLLQRMVRRFTPVLHPLIIVAAPKQRIPSLSQGRIVRDSVAWEGPLQGFYTGLKYLNGCEAFVFLSGCDAPFVSMELIPLLQTHMCNGDAAVPYLDGHYQPLAGLYRASLVDTIESLLKKGVKRFQALFDHCRVTPVNESDLRVIDPDLLSFETMNTPQAYQLALDILSIRG